MRFFADYLQRDFLHYGGGKGGSPQTVTNQTQLPAFITQGGQQNLDIANQIAAQPYQDYPGQSVAGLTPDQQAAFNAVRGGYANAGNQIGAATSAITGPNLTTTAQSLLNPYLSNVEQGAETELQRSGQLAQNDLASKAASAGAFGGTRFGLQSAALSSDTARQAGELSANIRSAGWNTAMNTALQQAGAVGQLANLGQTAMLTGASALNAGGAQQQTQQQNELNDLISRWQAARDYPLEGLAIRESALSSTPFAGMTTSTQPLNAGNPALGALGGAATGAALGSAFGPIGTGIGGVGGALLSLFGGR